jgi:hypothetical protein
MSKHCPFNGDRFIGEEIRKLVGRFGIQSIVETGTWSAHSTREFRRMVAGHVVTIDTTWEHLTEEFGPQGVEDLKGLGIIPVKGNSRDVLGGVLMRVAHPVLVYLDAHGVGNPLLEELDALGAEPECRDRCVIAVHDFQVPGREWGYNWGDWGRGAEPLSLALIEGKLPAIYPRGFGYHYNDQAEGCQRGIIYVYPKR